MSFLNLIKSAPPEGKIKLRGGQTQGYMKTTGAKLTVDTFIPTIGKGSEYVRKYKAEEEKAYAEFLKAQKDDRIDVTSEEYRDKLDTVDDLTSIGTLPNLQELNREDLTQVFQNYTFSELEPNEHLEPIRNEKDEILKTIEVNPVCIITGQTGCGKSTQIPQFILDSHVKNRTHCNIVVTQPRRIAAITIAQHVCEERKWSVGSIVGYQVGLEKNASEDTRLLYCTTGVLLEKLIAAKELNEFTHIILDEVHEREEDMDFVMLVIRKFLRTNSQNVKIILMSATMNAERFADYFEFTIKNKKHPAPIYEIADKTTHLVQCYYLDSLRELGNLPIIDQNEPGISQEGYDLVPEMIKGFNKIDAEDFKQKRSHDEKGAVLIFLPGLHQIETLFELLVNRDKRYPTELKLWLCPLHSSITKEEQAKVRRFAPPGFRKVILSTNIAESSITIPDVKYVIDFCLTKHLVADPVTGFTSLQLAWASHTNCIQRKGRVGRVQDGRVFRMVPNNFYLHKMSKECLPEMQRCPLEIIVLKCKKLMSDECPLRLISNALDPPDLDNYEKTIRKLKEIGALLVTCRGEETVVDGDLTFMGQVMGSLPLDIHITKLILLGHIFDVLEEAIIMGCSMSVRNIFSEPFQRRLDAYNNKLLWADTSESDSVAYLNAYRMWRERTALGYFNRSTGSEEVWARCYLLQIKHLREVAKLEDDVKKRLKRFKIHNVREQGRPLWNVMEKPLILKLVLAGAFYPHYYSTCQAEKMNMENEAVKELSGHNPYSCVYLQNMPHPAPLYLDQVKQSFKKFGISENVQFFHNDTRKIIVDFGSNDCPKVHKFGDRSLHLNIPGEIVMPVYRAIKLRQLNLPISVKMLAPGDAKERITALSLQSRSSMLSVASSDYKPQISLYQQLIEIEVSHVENAGEFYGQIQPSAEKLYKIFKILNEDSSRLTHITGDLVDDFIYAAPFRDQEDDECKYYRAKIKEKLEHQGEVSVNVFFIDYGNSAFMKANDLRELVEEEHQTELEKIPPLALKCRLAEVGPGVWSKYQGVWSEKANKYVHDILLNRVWITRIYSYVQGVAHVHLFLSDDYTSSKSEQPTLNDQLIKKGYAIPKEELYFSKVNHNKRMQLEEQEYNLVPKSSHEEEGDPSFNSLMKILPNITPTRGGGRSMDLNGPFSPLEMKLRSLIRCTMTKDVKVEWNSVNSVLLDSDPSDTHERLLVAGFVSQSTDGRKLTLNHTTVLPNMHGLAALICLIFAPNIELRTDENYSRYTGALCGLGMKKIGTPLFSANDMEINFDVEFTNEDLIQVNKLRYWMNERFCSEDADDMSDDRIIQIKNNIRVFTYNVLKPQRPSVTIYRNPNTFMWGQVPEQRIRHPVPEANAFDFTKFIYPLIYGIDINVQNDRHYIKTMLESVKTLKDAIARGITPRENKCELCDINFRFYSQLRLHMSASHHLHLLEWLTRRAAALKPPLSIEEN